MPKKIERGDPLESSGFVGYVKKVKNEGGALCSRFALVELGLSELISFCRKWYIRDELCGLTKKKRKNKTGTSKVGAISKAQKAPFSKYAQDVFMKSFENTFETHKVCLSCSL